MISTPDRERAVRLIKETTAAGARTFKVCEEMGISALYIYKHQRCEHTTGRWAIFSREFKTDQPGQRRKSARNTPFIRPIHDQDLAVSPQMLADAPRSRSLCPGMQRCFTTRGNRVS